MSVLVVGATGFVGSSLVAALATTHDVRAGSRHPPRHLPARTTWTPCDVSKPETIAPALAGCDVAYYLVHSMGQPGTDFRAVDRACATAFAEQAASSGCRRIVYLSGVAPRGPASEHLASRLEVGEILRAGVVSTLELRASMIVGNGSASWRIVRDLAARLPFMVLPRWLDSKSCPIALPDVLTALRAAHDVELPASTWFDIPGPDVVSVREMLECVAELEGRRIPAVRVPVLTPRLSAMWLRLVSGANYAVARELVLGLTGDLLPTRSFWHAIDEPVRCSFRDAAAAALASESPPSPAAQMVEHLVQRIGRRAIKREEHGVPS